MQVKVSEASGPTLDWMVAKCENADWSDEDCIVNVTTLDEYTGTICNYSTDWAQGGPIIEQAGISLWNKTNSTTISSMYWSAKSERYVHSGFGPTPLIAAMRCYCLSKLGEECEVPDELA
jgi:hypothetical protein